MAKTPSPRFGNHLLDRLPKEDARRLAPLLESVPLILKTVLYRVRAPVDYVYFPARGVVSAMNMMKDGRAIEVATIGKEGMTALTAFLNGKTSPYEVMVQVAGEGWRIAVGLFQKEVRGESALRQILARYHTAFSMQVSFAVACNGLHKIEQRCCRWLLMTQDRVESTLLPLTHELLSIMLGVRRASVTEVLLPLQESKLIHCERGTIEVLNRRGLEKRACECYGAVQEEFARQFG